MMEDAPLDNQELRQVENGTYRLIDPMTGATFIVELKDSRFISWQEESECKEPSSS